MSCDLSKGRLEFCKDIVGGIKSVYFANFDVLDVTFDSTVDNVIEDLQASAGGAVTFYKYDLRGDSNLVQNINSSLQNGTTFFEQVLNMTIKKLDKTTHKEVKLMASGHPIVVIHDHNGNAFACGLYEGMDVTGGTIVTGGAKGDLSGYTLVLTGMEKDPAFFLEGSTETDPFAGLTTAPTIVEGTAYVAP